MIRGRKYYADEDRKVRAKDENTAIDIPFDPETQAKINDLYNEVYSTLPNIEEFFNQYLSSDN